MVSQTCVGPIVRIAPDELSFFDIDAYVGEVYTNNTKFTKSHYFYGRQQNQALNVFSELDRATHSAEKRLISALLLAEEQHSFSRRNLLGMQDMINANTQRWVDQLRSSARKGDWVALWDATRCLTLDTIATFSYGSPEGGIDSSDYQHETFDVFNQIPTIAPAVQNLPLVPFLFKLLAAVNPSFVESRLNQVSQGRLHPNQVSIIPIIATR